ncbi:putative membrane protein [Tamaricihabitans halophyticus]|uniref:Putative membrane protein n=1 Tax=Tamaricihabitans halophyticus TaxID=1262583 RepID=A0A4R2QL89_9PSEU|nr:YhgE/Pip family protein [Tamaricihabitans halophyticus]TCP47801.1 putative membrane protein [Tamaricihabitans halophyticus]
MNTLRLARNEFRRITAGRLPKLAVLALILVPLLYGALYLYANADPYDRLDRVPAALVVADRGADGADGEHTNAGQRIADQLIESGAFEWHRVSESEAQIGVREGQYTFALTVPRDFTAALYSSADFQPRTGTLQLTTNDANNYLAGTIADKLGSEIRKSVASEVGTQAADQFLAGFGTIHQQVSKASQGAVELTKGAGKLSQGTTDLLGGSERLAGGLQTLQDKTADLPGQSERLAEGARQVAAGNERVAQAGNELAGTTQQLVNRLDGMPDRIAERLRAAGVAEADVQQVLTELGQLHTPIAEANGKVQDTAGQLRTLANGAEQVSSGADQLAGSAPELTNGISTASSGADELLAGARKLDTGAGDLHDGSTELRNGLRDGLKEIPNPDEQTREDTANTIGDPVGVQTTGQASAGSYGAGLAPFFLSLAAWIGAFVLFLLLRPLSSRALAAGQPAWRVALAGWFPAALLGLCQVVVMFAVVVWLVGITPAHPIQALGVLALASLAFTAILHALNAALGAVGKFLGLLILILQLVSAGGTFPWQTIPDALQPLHQVLPMGYVVHGLRHTLYAGASMDIGGDIAVLIAYLIGALALTTAAAYRQRVWTPSKLKPELVL